MRRSGPNFPTKATRRSRGEARRDLARWSRPDRRKRDQKGSTLRRRLTFRFARSSSHRHRRSHDDGEQPGAFSSSRFFPRETWIDSLGSGSRRRQGPSCEKAWRRFRQADCFGSAGPPRNVHGVAPERRGQKKRREEQRGVCTIFAHRWARRLLRDAEVFSRLNVGGLEMVDFADTVDGVLDVGVAGMRSCNRP